MKTRTICISALLIVACAIMNSCGLFEQKGPEKEYLDYLRSDQYRKDLDNLIYMATLKQCVKYSVANAFSNGYTLKEGQKLDFKRKKREYWGELLAFMNALAENKEEFEASLKRLEDHKVFSTPSPVRNKKGRLTAMYQRQPQRRREQGYKSTSLQVVKSLPLGGDIEEAIRHPSSSISFDLIATPACAAPVRPALAVQPLLVQEFCEFCDITTELAKESRRMTVACASNLSNNDLRDIYNRLDPDVKAGTTDYKTWWNNLQNGKYDVKGHRIFSSIVYDQTHPSNEHFMEEADKMGLLDPKNFVEKAKKVVTAGAKLNIDCINKVLGANITGYSDVYDKVEIAVSTTNLGGKIVTGEVTMEDAAEYVALTEKTWIGEKIKGVNMNIPGVGSIELGKNPFWDAGEIQGMCNVALNKANKLLDKMLGEDNEPKLDWEDEPEPAVITVKDNDSDSPAEQIIVEDANTGEVFISLGADDEGNTTIAVPGGGNYNITTVDQNGDKWTTTEQHIEEGETVELEGDTEENEMWDELFEQMGNDEEEDEDEGNFFDNLIDIINGDKDVFGNDISSNNDDESLNTDGIEGISDMTDEEAEEFKNALDEREAERNGKETSGEETTGEEEGGFWNYITNLITGKVDLFGNPVQQDETGGKDPNAGVIPPGEDEPVDNGKGEQYVPSVDSEPTDAEFIVGRWKTIEVEKLIDTDEDDWITLDDEDWAIARSIKLNIKDNGTCTLSSKDESISGTYKFDGMTLAMHAQGESIICPISKLGDNKMRLTYSDADIIAILIMQK